jgi:hypothetical protein
MYRLLLLLGFATTLAASAPQAMPDAITAQCLLGVESTHNRTEQLCLKFRPDLKLDLKNAARKWRFRNSARLTRANQICEMRLLEAYGDQSTVRKEKKKMEVLMAEFDRNLLADPHLNEKVNCEAYAEALASGASGMDVEDRDLDELQTAPISLQAPDVSTK